MQNIKSKSKANLPQVFNDTLLQAVIASAPVAIAYFAGWAYISHILISFSVEATEIDIPLTTVLVLSARPLGSLGAGLAIGGFLLCAVLAGYFKIRVEFPPRYRSLSITLPFTGLIVIGGLYGLSYIAKTEAKSDVVAIISGERFENLVVAEKNDEEAYRDYQSCYRRGSLLQVFSTEKRTVLYCPDTQDIERGAVYMLDEKRAIISVRSRSGEQR